MARLKRKTAVHPDEISGGISTVKRTAAHEQPEAPLLTVRRLRLSNLVSHRMAQEGSGHGDNRWTVAGTRLWIETVSVLNVKGKTHGITSQIPYPAAERQYRALYPQMRDSFRLTR